MKKLFLFAVVVVFTVTSTFAQGEVRFGVKGGVNLASIGGDAYLGIGGLDSRTGFHIGALVEIPFTDKISLQPEVLYSAQGSKFNFGTGNGERKLNYINIPILGKYHIIAGLSGELGPVIGVLANADDGAPDAKDRYKAVDIGVGIGASYRLPMGVFGSLRYNKGVSNINEDIPNSSVQYKNQNNVFQVSAGYSF